MVQELQRDLTEKRSASANSSFSANHRSDYQHDSEMSERDRMEWKIQSELLRKDLEALKDQQSWKVESQNLYRLIIWQSFDPARDMTSAMEAMKDQIHSSWKQEYKSIRKEVESMREQFQRMSAEHKQQVGVSH